MIIFGTSQSRTFRVLWMAIELDLPFTHRPLVWERCGEDAELLAVNPAGTVPALLDGDFALAESLAINLYLARKAGRLLPDDLQGEARVLQWSFWAATALEPGYIGWGDHTHWWPAERRRADVAAAALRSLARPLDRLEAALTASPWLVGDEFSAADLNVAGVISLLRSVDRSARPALADWLDRCLSRPACIAAARLP